MNLVRFERTSNGSHRHVHVIGSNALREILELLFHVSLVLMGEGRRSHPIASGTVAGCAPRNSTRWIAGNNQAFRNIFLVIAPPGLGYSFSTGRQGPDKAPVCLKQA